ncbi:MAG: cation transporter [Caulobacteraceae bacterium]
MADGSTRVVLAALAGNLAIAVVKFAAFLFTRSSAMLTESIHSLVDTGDQLLLLTGQARGSRPPDATHPLGYGMETYFWSFIVALMVFLLGGAASIWQGVAKIAHPVAMSRPWINYVVLAISAVFEAGSFMAAYREYRRVVRGRDIRLFRYLRLSKDRA